MSCVYATTVKGVDWDAIRLALVNERARAGYKNPAEFAKASPLAKTTIYRVESGEVRPDLDTIEAWLQASTRRSLTDFFGDLAALTLPVTAALDDDAHSPQGGIPHGVLVSADPATLELVRDFCLDISAACLRTVERIAERQAGTAAAGETPHGQGGRGSGGSTAA